MSGCVGWGGRASAGLQACGGSCWGLQCRLGKPASRTMPAWALHGTPRALLAGRR